MKCLRVFSACRVDHPDYYRGMATRNVENNNIGKGGNF
jgi:hypothetical protein